MLGGSRGSELGIAVTYECHDSVKGSAELHGFRWGVVLGVVVDAAPGPWPGVVTEKSRASIPFVFDSGR